MVSRDTWYDTDGEPHTAYVVEPRCVCCGDPADIGHWLGPSRCSDCDDEVLHQIFIACRWKRTTEAKRAAVARIDWSAHPCEWTCCDAPAWMRALYGHQRGHRTPPDEGLFDPPRRRSDALWGRRRE